MATFSLQDFLPKLRLQNLVYEILAAPGRYNGSMKLLQQQAGGENLKIFTSGRLVCRYYILLGVCFSKLNFPFATRIMICSPSRV